MRRDDVAIESPTIYKQQTDNATDLRTRNYVNATISPQLPQTLSTSTTYLVDDKSFSRSSLSEKSFYDSYKPEVGINIVTVLGGILLLLVVYVIYRTKCRKYIIKTVQNCTMKYCPEEHPVAENTNLNVDSHVEQKALMSENVNMLTDHKYMTNDFSEKDNFVQRTAEVNDVEKDISERRQSALKIHSTHEKYAIKENDNNQQLFIQSLPESEGNVEHATAQWIQNVKEMDIKEKQLNGIILKIPAYLLYHNAKVRSHFNSVTDYFEQSDLFRISRNISLPSLIEKQTFVNSHNTDLVKDKIEDSTDTHVPVQTLDCWDIRSQQHQIKHQSDSKTPLDICPIIKVRHYYSRSKIKTSSNSQSKSDLTSSSLSSSSSEQSLMQDVVAIHREFS